MSGQRRKARTTVTLVFGEDETDRKAIAELARAIRPDLLPYASRRAPLILVKGRTAAEARKVGAKVANVVRADQQRHEVRAVLAHEDCDATEPAHEAHCAKIETALAVVGPPVVAVVPAWEIEAWWFLWPDAVVAVNPQWTRPAKTGREVGRIEHAKEELRRSVRAGRGDKPPRDFEPSDGPRVAAKVRELALIHRLDAVSASFLRFRDRLAGA